VVVLRAGIGNVVNLSINRINRSPPDVIGKYGPVLRTVVASCLRNPSVATSLRPDNAVISARCIYRCITHVIEIAGSTYRDRVRPCQGSVRRVLIDRAGEAVAVAAVSGINTQV